MLKKEVMEHSSQVIVIANKEKLGSIATFRSNDISVIDILVTNEMDESFTYFMKYSILSI